MLAVSSFMETGLMLVSLSANGKTAARRLHGAAFCAWRIRINRQPEGSK